EAAVEVLVEAPTRRARLATAGYHYLREHYSWQAVIDRYEHELLALTANAAGSAPRERRGALP
ncbi:MAG: hypothetical protein JWL70_917, partial [Acidimicrobiia bacterium]|nr:hypothetical protein [Acidimicrobiia bacterium]